MPGYKKWQEALKLATASYDSGAAGSWQRLDSAVARRGRKAVATVYRLEGDSTCALAFSGTQLGPDLVDVSDDLAVVARSWCGFRGVFRGFATSMDRFLRRILTVADAALIHEEDLSGSEKILRELQGPECRHIIATGHSLGGAKAELFTACAHAGWPGHPAWRGIQVEEVYTFGAPGVSDPPLYSKRTEDRCFPGLRVYNQDIQPMRRREEDPVPALLEGVYDHPKMSALRLDKAVFQEAKPRLMHCSDAHVVGRPHASDALRAVTNKLGGIGALVQGLAGALPKLSGIRLHKTEVYRDRLEQVANNLKADVSGNPGARGQLWGGSAEKITLVNHMSGPVKFRTSLGKSLTVPAHGQAAVDWAFNVVAFWEVPDVTITWSEAGTKGSKLVQAGQSLIIGRERAVDPAMERRRHRVTVSGEGSGKGLWGASAPEIRMVNTLDGDVTFTSSTGKSVLVRPGASASRDWAFNVAAFWTVPDVTISWRGPGTTGERNVKAGQTLTLG